MRVYFLIAMSRVKRFNSDKIVAFTAIIISLCALVVSFYEVRIMRTQQEASVWPYVVMEQQYSGEGFAIEAANKGLGPAKIESFRVWAKGKPVFGLNEIFEVLIGEDHGITYNDFSVNDINKSVLEPRYRKPLFRLKWTEKTREVQKRLSMMNVEIIYSSILGECWKLTLREQNTPCECPKIKEEEQFYF